MFSIWCPGEGSAGEQITDKETGGAGAGSRSLCVWMASSSARRPSGRAGRPCTSMAGPCHPEVKEGRLASGPHEPLSRCDTCRVLPFSAPAPHEERGLSLEAGNPCLVARALHKSFEPLPPAQGRHQAIRFLSVGSPPATGKKNSLMGRLCISPVKTLFPLISDSILGWLGPLSHSESGLLAPHPCESPGPSVAMRGRDLGPERQ